MPHTMLLPEGSDESSKLFWTCFISPSLKCYIIKIYYYKSVSVKYKTPLATNDNDKTAYVTILTQNTITKTWKTASSSDVVIKAGLVFVSIQNSTNKVFLTAMLIPCDSENTSNKLLKVWFRFALISKFSMLLTDFPL